MDKTVLEQDGYIGVIEYCPDVHGCHAKSKSYKLIISKDGKVLKNRFGFTFGGAKKEFECWVAKQVSKLNN